MPRLFIDQLVNMAPALKNRWFQVGCVGAHGCASYHPSLGQGLWAHGRAPLQALINIKWGF